MPKPTSVGRAYARAHTQINRAFDSALDKLGRVPFGEDVVDPRTLAARKALYNGMTPTLPMDSNFIKPKPFVKGNNPMPPRVAQTPKVAAAGKVVDPSAIETAQSADWVDVDSATSAGIGGQGLTEGN